MSERGTHSMSKAREAAARALNTLWCPTCEPYEHTDDAHRAYCAKSANAAIDAFLASLSEDEDMVERVAKAIREMPMPSGDNFGTFLYETDECPGPKKQALERLNKLLDRLARAAIATLKQEAGQ